MDLEKANLPDITMQESESKDGREVFIARQVVSNQSEKEVNINEANCNKAPIYKQHRYLTELIMFIIILAIIPVAIYQFTKASIQRYIDQKKRYSSESFSG